MELIRGVSPPRAAASLIFLLSVLAGAAGVRPAVGADLGTGRLLVAGTRLTVSPESQTVPFETPTVVETHLEGFDPSNGSLPPDLRVEADLTGPEIDGVLTLETSPDEPLRIPRLTLKGEYRLDDIRLVEGDELLAYAAPRSASLTVTQVLVTRVTSRPLTLDEIRSYGIVVDGDDFKAFNFTFGFGVDGDEVDYNVPVIWVPSAEPAQPVFGAATGGQQSRFTPPQMAPFFLAPRPEPGEPALGGCQEADGDCTVADPPPLPGAILFPTDLGLLNQFFSVVLMVQNGAPAGDPLVVRDLTARIRLPPGLRQAETEPPTPLGVPVPVRVPGPDGKLGTADDLTFLVAQATGEAEYLVEGLTEGTHVVDIDIDGVVEGLPSGIQHVAGTARGAVVVRDPTFGITISHPDVVRRDEEYPLRLTVSNTSNAPANLVTVSLPASRLSGVELVDPTQFKKTIDQLLPGESELVEFRLRALRTGRVVAASARSSAAVTPTFELTVGVGENGIPLSPTEIVLPRATENLPPDLVRSALNLVGLGFSLATASPSVLDPDLPQVSRAAVDRRVSQLARAGRYVGLGEELFDSAAVLAAEWTGARDGDWDWDGLRRTTSKGAETGDALGRVFAAEAARSGSLATFERFARDTASLPPLAAVFAVGDGASLEVASRTSGKRLAGRGTAADRLRELPFADLFDLSDLPGTGSPPGSEMALLAVPEDGGYRARLSSPAGGPVELHVLLPPADGRLRVLDWSGLALGPGGTVTADFRPDGTAFVLDVDSDGDGVVDDERTATVRFLAPRTFTALAAVQDAEADPTGHVVDVLFSDDVDLGALSPRDPGRFTLPGKVSNGGLIPSVASVAGSPTSSGGRPARGAPSDGLRETRIVRVVFDNPISPYSDHPLTVSDVASVRGQALGSVTLPVAVTVDTPGTLVEGTVFGPDGEPAPFARVRLHEADFNPLKDQCVRHVTAAVQADAAGKFLFDYVRQTSCGGLYTLEATDPATGKRGTASGRVRSIGQTVSLDVVMVGRGVVRGHVAYDDGTVPAELHVVASNPVFRESRVARLDAQGNYDVGDLPVGTVSLAARDGKGSFALATVEIPTAGAVVERDLTIVRRPEQPTGNLRATVLDAAGATPAFNAFVALYEDGRLLEVKRSAADGGVDFGVVPAGTAEIEAFDGETGRSGAHLFFEVEPDRVNEVDVLLEDARGTVEGFVRRQTPDGIVPVAGAVVFAFQTPFHTTTAADGSYRLENVFVGRQDIRAVDLVRNRETRATVTLTAAGDTVSQDLLFADDTPGGVAGEVLDFAGNPVPGATVHLALDDQHWFREAFTDLAGDFRITGLPPGVYRVHAFLGADGGIAQGQVRFSGDTPFVTVRFKKGTIRGVVEARNESGGLVGVRSVVRYRTTVVRLGLVGPDLESHDIETADDGTFEIPDVLAGHYTLTVFNSFQGQKTVEGDLVTNGQVAEHEIVFERNGTIEGVVLDHDGVTPVPGAQVDLRHPSFSGFNAVTDDSGEFRFELVPPAPQPFAIDARLDGMVFRTARVWVRFDRFGQQLRVEIVLPEQGSVSGRVEDSDGQPVPRAQVALQESEFPRRLLTQEADDSGAFSFSNVFVGRSTLAALAPSLGGLGGKTTVDLEREGQELAGVVVRLQDTGEIAGRVLSPVDGSPVPGAEVRLLRGGLFDSANTDGDGRFTFPLLPLATYSVRAFDPRTGRQGEAAGVTVSSNGEQVAADVVLEARGEVVGHLFQPQSTVPVPGAAVTLHTRSLVELTTYSSTDADGGFDFLGVPQGTFTLEAREPAGRRRATGSGEIASEGDRATVDLFLEESGSVAGSVLNPQGVADGPFSPSDVRLFQDGQLIAASLANPYRFEGVIAGRPFFLQADEPGGAHRGAASGVLTNEGEEVALDVRMQPIGAVEVAVVDSDGQPVVGADVELVSGGFYGTQRFSGGTGEDNLVTFQGVGAGGLTAFARSAALQLGGSASGSLALEGETAHVTVALEDSGRVRGTLLLADGVTPAEGALAVLQVAGRTLRRTTDAQGIFDFPSVPLGAFRLDFQQDLGPGTLRTTGAVQVNDEVVDLGTLVLDDRDPEVVAVEPADGAVGVLPELPILVRFSEPLDGGLLNGNWTSLRRTTGDLVPVDLSLADGGVTLVVTPRQPLGSFTSYQVKVTIQVTDLAGRHLAEALQTTFTTADVVPPRVAGVVPMDGAVQVPVTTQVAVSFSEPVDFSSLSGAAFELVDAATGAGVATTFTLLPGERDVVLTPVEALTGETLYRLVVQGVRDRAGNVLDPPFASAFETVDTTPPTVALAVPDGPLAEGVEVVLTATPLVAPDLASVSFFDGDRLLGTVAEAPYTVAFTPDETDAAAASVTLSAVGVDRSGNIGPAAEAVREVTPNLPPAVDLTLDPAAEILPGGTLVLSTTVTDEGGLATVDVTLRGAVTDHFVLSPGGASSFTFDHRFTAPLFPATRTIDVIVTATDGLGKVTETDPRTVQVLEDVEAPVFTALAPADGTVVTAGDPVTASAEVSDNVEVTSVTFRFGEQSFVDETAPYEWTVAAPAVTTATDLTLEAEARDPFGNVALEQATVRVEPIVDPDKPVIAILCPSNGALLAPGTGLDVTVDATDDQGVAKVDFFVDGAAVATDFDAPYTYHLVAPATAVDGDVLHLEAVVSDFGGKTDSDAVDVRVVEGTVLTSSHTLLAADDTHLDGATVVVAAGLLTVEGPHAFRDLVVLPGAAVTHPLTTPDAVFRLELALDRGLYVACGARIDVTAEGFPGAPPGGRGWGFGDTQAEGAADGAGGSHGGRGGDYNGSGPVYGNLFDPREPGAGGASSGGASAGRAGGGVIRIAAGGDMVVDGAIRANGQTSFSGGGGGGAGGAIRLDATALSGNGQIEASGSPTSLQPSGGGGGGGRIALYAASVDPGLLARTRAAGAANSLADPGGWGAAGTLYVRLDGAPLGDLVLDNGGLASSQPTELLPVARGVIDVATATSLTDFEADFRSSLAGAEVALNGDLSVLWPITGNDHHGQTLTLDTSAVPFPGQPGDGYEGVYRFDHLRVRGGARGLAIDRVLVTAPPEVDPGSSWQPAYEPSLAATAPVAGAVFTAGDEVPAAATVDDALGVAEIELVLGEEVAVDTAAPYSAVLHAPPVAAETAMTVIVRATDYGGKVLAAEVPITVEPSPDAVPPAVTLAPCPKDGDLVLPGAIVPIAWTASDDASLAGWTVAVDGVVVDSAVAVAAPEVSATFPFAVPADAAPGTVFTVRVEAEDYGTNRTAAELHLAVPSVPVLAGGGDLDSTADGTDLVLGAGTFTLQGPVSPASLTLLDGAFLTGLGGQVHLSATSAVRVQCGAAIDASAAGFAGGTLGSPEGGAPAGLAGSQPDAGGSHGGVGVFWDGPGPAGEIYDSVYLPSLPGGGGSIRPDIDTAGGAGGGVVEIAAGSLALDGEIRAQGESRSYGSAGGAGGTVVVRAATLSGAGRIDVSGGSNDQCFNVGGREGGGGGGRAALEVETFSGFDPVAQVRARGGAAELCGSPFRHAAPGTLYVRTAGAGDGDLYLDQGGAGGASVANTVLPSIGSGTVGVAEPDASSPSDLWIEDADPSRLFDLGVVGMDVRVDAIDYPVLGESAGRHRLLLGGAAGIVGVGSAYQGVYRFDTVTVRGGAILELRDADEVGTFFVDPDSGVVRNP